jgi:hypothetical protein
MGMIVRPPWHQEPEGPRATRVFDYATTAQNTAIHVDNAGTAGMMVGHQQKKNRRELGRCACVITAVGF